MLWRFTKPLWKFLKELKTNLDLSLLECNTFRMRGHEEASGTKYVPNELFKKWSKKDPVVNFEKFLINQKLFTEEKIENTKASIKKEINIAIEKAFNESQIECDLDFEKSSVFRHHNFNQIQSF